MRSLYSLKNTIVSIIMSIVNVLVTFVSQRILLKVMGAEYLGLNGLFGNILSVLSIAELGFGTAIIYSMYKPIAEKDNETIKSLMNYYKNVYRVVAAVVTLIGILIIPFLDIIVGKTTISINLTFLYVLYLFDCIASYLLGYKRSILYASQQTYYINIVHIAYLILLDISQIIILILTQNYVLYLIIKIIYRVIENIVNSIIATKKYPFIKEKNISPVKDDTKNKIGKSVRGLIYHKISGTIIGSSNTMIISSVFGLEMLGYYTNYITMIVGLNILISQIFSALTSSVGNLLLENDKEKSYNIFKSMKLFNFWIYSFGAIGIVMLAEPFITIWIGEKYILPFSILIFLCIDFYFGGMKRSYNVFKEAAGIFYEDRFIAVAEMILNIVLSLTLVLFMGINGVILGTVLSSLLLFLYDYPKFVYKKLFDKEYKVIVKEDVTLLTIFLITFFSIVFISNKIMFISVWKTILVRLLIVIIVPNLIYLLIFHNKDEFKYYLGLYRALKERIFEKKSN